MNEAETRAEHIDPALKAAGWGLVEGSRVLREHGITLGRLQGSGGKGARANAEIADYVLVYRNTKLAVIEAKAWDKPHSEGVGQAKSYAAKLAVRFAYATNGQAIYGIDMVTGAEGDVTSYPSPEELWKQTNVHPSAWRDRFAAVPFEDKGGTWQGRYYQDIAITRVLEAVGAGRDRILLTLATGTGKTFIAFQLAWKLFQSRWNLADWKSGGEPARRPRILFLADRNILADQAYNAFSAFPDDALVRIAPDDIRRKGRVPKNGSIFFTIFQTFMSGPGGAPYFGEYPPDFGVPMAGRCRRRSFWSRCSAPCPSSSETRTSCAACGAIRILGRSYSPIWRIADLEETPWLRCSASLMRRVATCTTSWLTWRLPPGRCHAKPAPRRRATRRQRN
ncbi:hypothetical protein GCM10028813_21230 [Ramlibacter alkalitolerans]|uniref:DEAD/DEAH box helicase family protein n=1 Tax=Ramlibacter alkalitolerans TaxID=2039631 RepID=A0ABS1JSW9_9BURK|nr:DEAD/DEAH box helicase family protein [Ramlibacter alkalitolerans]